MKITDITFKDGRKLDIKYPIMLKNKNGNEIYYEDSKGFWCKREYDKNDNRTYYENSDGYKTGTPKSETMELTVKDIEKLLGHSVKIVKG